MNKKIIKNLQDNVWRFAKMMPESPHWYTLRKTWENDIQFVETVLYIRKHGYTEYYKNRPYIMLNLNGYKYWTMGASINKKDGTPYTILINKAKINYKADYDKIAKKYDGLFSEKKYIEENEKVIKLIKPKGNILDIGCGTGLFLDYFIPKKYTGIDISVNMLSIFEKKHPDHDIINTSFEDFYTLKKFDTIISLFGSPNYIKLESLWRAKKMLTEKGKLFFMFFKNGYYPETYKKTGIDIPFYNCTTKGKEYKNFIIITS